MFYLGTEKNRKQNEQILNKINLNLLHKQRVKEKALQDDQASNQTKTKQLLVWKVKGQKDVIASIILSLN